MLTCLGAPEASYNVVLALLLLWSSLVRVGRLNLLCMQIQVASFGVDVLALASRSDSWAHKGFMSSLGLALFIVLLFVKSVALLAMLIIHGEVGASNLPAAGALGLGMPGNGHGGGGGYPYGPLPPPSGTGHGGFGSSSSSLSRPPSSLGGGQQQHQPQTGRLSRSGSFATHAMAAPHTPSHGNGGESYHEQQSLLGSGQQSQPQQPRGMSPGPTSGSFRVPVAQPAPVHGYQAGQL
jgi:hypothetical protein